MADGLGKFHQIDGGYYEGSFKEDIFHGYGKHVSADQKVIYEG